MLFDSGGGLWRLYRAGGGRQFVFTSPPFGARPYQAARFSDDFTEGEVEVRRDVFASRLPLYPLHYPLDELLMVHLLARGRGIEVHGSGFVDADGQATLFAGQSGAGKTTMARLWLGEPDVTILSDERVILRREGETIWMYGTPWHGDGHIVNPGRGRLTRIFFLRHAPANAVTPLSATQAIARSVLVRLCPVSRSGRPRLQPGVHGADRPPLSVRGALLRARSTPPSTSFARAAEPSSRAVGC